MGEVGRTASKLLGNRVIIRVIAYDAVGRSYVATIVCVTDMGAFGLTIDVDRPYDPREVWFRVNVGEKN